MDAKPEGDRMIGLRVGFAVGAVTLSVLGVLGCSSAQKESPKAAPAAKPEKTAKPETPEDLQKVIIERDAQRAQAMIQADAKALDEILRDDVTYIHSSGPIEGKAQVIKEITSGKLKYTGIEPSEVGVRVYGDTAISTGRVLLKSSSLGKSMQFSVRFTEVWLRSHGVWQLAAWQSTRIPES
jgi:ketosteroid isomerase-like protein